MTSHFQAKTPMSGDGASRLEPPARGGAPAYAVPPVHRAFSVLRHIAAGHACGNPSQAAKALGINRTTLIRLLATLEAERIIEPRPEGDGYRLGTGLIALASAALNTRGVVEVSRPVLRELVATLNLSAHLGVREGSDIVYLARETPVSHLASTVREGTRLPAHATTIGRILLAELPADQVAALYGDQPLPAYTDKTRTSLADLQVQLDGDRARGIAWSVANFEPGIGSAAAAVYDHLGQAVAAVNVTGPAAVFQTLDPEPIEAALTRAARAISEGLGFSGDHRST